MGNSVNNTNQNNNSLSKKLFFLDNIAKFCDKCGTTYTPDNIRIIRENGLATIIHFSCSKCKTMHIANFIIPLGLASRVPLNTDLTQDEIVKFASMKKISSDEVLNLYESIKSDTSASNK